MGSGGKSLLWTLIASLVVILVLGGAAAGVVWWLGKPKPVAIDLNITGTNGVEVEGTAEVDGVTQELKGTVPTKFRLEGRRILFSLTTKAESGEFQVHAMRGDRAVGSGGSLNPPRYGVRGWVKSEWGWDLPQAFVETFKPGDNTGWPPP